MFSSNIINLLVQGNSNKRSSEGGDEQPAGKKARADTMQAPVTTFNNPKSSLPTAPNSFSINQLLTPPTTFSSPLTSTTGMDEKDYRAYAHHPSAHGYPPHHMMMPYSSDPSRPDSKSHMEGRSFASPLTSYLPEDDGRHLEGAPLIHSSDPYYYHKLAYQYYPRQMLPPTAYPPPPPHALSTSPHHARSPYYLPFGGPSHDSRAQQHLITDGHSEVPPSELQEQQQAQQSQHSQQPTSTPSQQQQQAQQTQQAQQQITQAQKTQQLQQRQTMQQPQQPQQQQQQPPQQQTTQQQQESLPKMNLPSSSPDMYKYTRNPPSPQSSSSYPQGSELPYFYHQYPNSQAQRLHPQ